ncbi:MAG: glycosyltransferase family 2 protein [Chloroflexota bacterium]
MQLSILIVSWNTRTLLEACLDSVRRELHASPGLESEIIVVDNASSDGSLEMIQQGYPECPLIANKHNRGFGAANNQAAAAAQGDFLLLLNPDTLLHPGLIAGLVEHLEKHPELGAVGPRVLNPDGSLQSSAHPTPTLFREAWRLFHLDNLAPISQYPAKFFETSLARPVDILKGACILLRRAALQGEKLFDERFFMYSEEVDLCLRLRQAGWQIHWLPTVSLVHYGGQSTQQIPEQMFLELYRNKVKFFRKHYGDGTAWIYKTLLFLAALPRCSLGLLPSSNHKEWKTTARHYRLLMQSVSGF